MGLSNYIPSSRLSQAGVCTSTTRPASPYEGQMIYETDTNRVLVYDASAWVMIADTDQPPGLQLVKTQTIGSAVASVTVNDAFSSEYENYRIVLSNVTLSAPSRSTNMYFQVASGGTQAASNYQFGIPRVDLANGTVSSWYGQNATVLIFATGVGDKFGSSFDVLMPYLATHTLFNNLSFQNTSDGYCGGGAGMHQTSSSYDGFRLSPSTGTMTGGTIRVYGYRNS